MKTIKIKNNNEIYNIFIDNDDFYKIKDYKWSVYKYGINYYASTSDKNKTIYMHRLIIDPPENMDVDHINNNGLDNRKDNLRICTRAQNSRNKRKGISKYSDYKGVSYNKRAKSYIAQIKYNYNCIFLGYFKNEIEAAKAYNKKAIELFGEFAKINIFKGE